MSTNKECQAETCLVCDSYNNLILLLAEGLTLEDAFVDVIQDVLQSNNDETFNEAYEIGFKEGALQAFKDVRDNADAVINKILCEDDCDCQGECKNN